VPVAERVGNYGASGLFSAVPNVLAYRSGGAAGALRDWQLTWLDRLGNQTGTVGEPGSYDTVALSPNGAQAVVALSANGSTGSIGNMDLWIIELQRGTPQRLTVDPALDRYPIWSPTGDRVVFGSIREGTHTSLYVRASDGSGADRLLLKTDVDIRPTAWSHDGRYVLFTSANPKSGDDVWLLPMDGAGKPTPLIETAAAERDAQFSGDMRWVSYTSDASGRFEVYVRPFNPATPDALTGASTRISKDGGFSARWRGDSKELFYLTAAGMIAAVDISGPGPSVGQPKTLFAVPDLAPWDVSADGQRFLVGLPPAASLLAPITIVTNWTAGLPAAKSVLR